VVTLAIAIACGASTTVLILGGGSSIALSVVRYLGKCHPRLVAGCGTPLRDEGRGVRGSSPRVDFSWGADGGACSPMLKTAT
jgi:hypothetical protein